jgi:hypothetical protein
MRNAPARSNNENKTFDVPSLLHRGFIFACLPDFYLFRRADFKATVSRRATIFSNQPPAKEFDQNANQHATKKLGKNFAT